MKFLDKNGSELKAGDYIVYGQALGRCAGINYGLVLGLTEVEDFDYFTEKTTKSAKVKFVGMADRWNERDPITLQSKPSYLYFPQRVLKINRVQMPMRLRLLFDGYEEPLPKKSRAKAVKS